MDPIILADDFVLAITLVVNVAIAQMSFVAYKKLQIKPFLMIGLSGLLGAATILITIYSLSSYAPINAGLSLWWITMILGLLDILMYGYGISTLVKYLLKEQVKESK